MKLVLITIQLVVGIICAPFEFSCVVADEFPGTTHVSSRPEIAQNTSQATGDRDVSLSRQLQLSSKTELFRDQQHMRNRVNAGHTVPPQDWFEPSLSPMALEYVGDELPRTNFPRDIDFGLSADVSTDSFAMTSFASRQPSGSTGQLSCPGSPPASGLAWQKGDWQITPYGFLAGEAIAADASISARPFVLYVNDDVGLDEPQFTPHGQTTALGFNFSGPAVGPFQSGGNILFNFLGGQPVLNQSSPFLLRGYGQLQNEDWRFGFGVAPDIFGAQTPRTVNFGGHLQAGNIAAFRGQLRVDRYIRIADDVRWTASAAISQQVVNDFTADPLTLGTDNGWPNLEGRLQLVFGDSKAAQPPLEIGVSGLVGQVRALRLTGSNVSATWGISTDGQVVGERFGARYELFAGQAIGTYNAAIGQSLNPENGEPIATVGGFVEGWCNLQDSVAWHIGYGIDNPNNSDLGRNVDPGLGPLSGQRSRNSVWWTSLFWNVTESFELGFEVSSRETEYIAPSVSNEAMVYHFRTRLIF